jgi:hypothetical protein
MSSQKRLRYHTFRLRLKYVGPSQALRAQLFSGMDNLDGDARSTFANRREIAFYREGASAGLADLASRCFKAVDATDITAWHLLFEDLTDSHFIATEWPLPPTIGIQFQGERPSGPAFIIWSTPMKRTPADAAGC